VLLGATPREATLYLDGERLGENPITLTRPGETSVRRLRAEAPGFESAEREVRLDHDGRFELVLSPSAPPPEREPRSLPIASGGASSKEPVSCHGSPPGASVTEGTARPHARPAHHPPPPAAPVAPEPRPGKRPLDIDRSNPWSTE
jgi:hypothetical protein